MEGTASFGEAGPLQASPCENFPRLPPTDTPLTWICRSKRRAAAGEAPAFSVRPKANDSGEKPKAGRPEAGYRKIFRHATPSAMTLVINNRTAVCAACPVFFHYISLNFPACQRGSSTVSGHHLLPQPLSVCPAMTSAAGFLPRAVIASIRPRKKFPRRRPPVFAYLYEKNGICGPAPGKVSPGEVWRDRPLLKRRVPPRSFPLAGLSLTGIRFPRPRGRRACGESSIPLLSGRPRECRTPAARPESAARD